MSKHLLYLLSTKLNAAFDHIDIQPMGYGMLLEKDADLISLKALQQYHFASQTNLSTANRKLAKRLNIGFIWQKFQTIDAVKNTTLSTKHLNSYDRSLIAFASRMLIICLAFLINSTQFNK